MLTKIEQVTLAVAELAAGIAAYRRIGFDLEERGRGRTGEDAIELVRGAEGLQSIALARRGPRPFQILYRTASMDAAAKWIADQGLPPPVRGVRNTGEQAMLVAPEHACGVYIGFVGMP